MFLTKNKKPRKYVFFFHYNKPASQSKGKPVISLHWKGACYLVDNVECACGTHGRIRNKQPMFVMTGKAEQVDFQDGIAYIR